MNNKGKSYRCNCKSINITDYHPTLVFGEQQCYYCGYYALEGRGSKNQLILKPKHRKLYKKSKKGYSKDPKKFIQFRNSIMNRYKKGMSLRHIAQEEGLSIKTIEAIKYLMGTYKVFRKYIND